MRTEQVPFNGACPVRNICVSSGGYKAPECGSMLEHTPPIYFAETSCLRALSGAHESLTASREGRVPSYILYAQAWSNVELGMAAKQDQTAEAHFKTASRLAEQLVWDKGCHIVTRVDAATLGVYLPAFEARRIGQASDPQVLQHVRVGLASVHDVMQALITERAAETGDERYMHAAITIPIFLAAARAGTLLYPASPRESQRFNYSPPKTGRPIPRKLRLLHDAYAVVGDGAKLPIKINNQPVRKSHAYKHVLHYRNMAVSTLQIVQRNRSLGGHLQYLESIGIDNPDVLTERVPQWLVAEAKGHELVSSQRIALDIFTGSIMGKLSEIQGSIQHQF